VYSAYEAVDAYEVDYDSVAQTCPPCVPMRYFKEGGFYDDKHRRVVCVVQVLSRRTSPPPREYFLRVAYSHLAPALGHSAPLSHSSYQD
jgi:hypothetical protein